MISKIFGIIVILSVISSLFTGKVEQVGTAVADGANSAVQLIISLTGMICLWSGIMRVLKSVGLIEKLAKLISPFLKILLPYTYKLKKQNDRDASSALQSVSANIGANILGIGNAATPLGIDAMKKLNDVKNKYHDKSTANGDMIMFAVFNCASLQIIPTTLIALRSAAGSEAVFEIIPAIWLCSVLTTAFAVIITKSFIFLFPFTSICTNPVYTKNRETRKTKQ
jgi:Uncharacterized membrane protein, required for spore maturation in B.subtilis.